MDTTKSSHRLCNFDEAMESTAKLFVGLFILFFLGGCAYGMTDAQIKALKEDSDRADQQLLESHYEYMRYDNIYRPECNH
ncbi:MAG: hypothetical protein MRJ65_14800 [Candidatus Brocadiaceae bacterium]|nr:hypothetical protein [Candidatus Brocadiaceae bacterium]